MASSALGNEYRLQSALFSGADTKLKEFEMLYNAAIEIKTDAHLVKIVFDMVDVLLKSGNAYQGDVHPTHMGINEHNRGGKKMIATSMQKKGAKIKNAGFVFKLCGPEKAIAIENDPNTNSTEKHTFSITESDEYFGDYKLGQIRAGSIGCSHLNQWLMAITSKAKSMYPDLCDPGTDRLSPYLLAKNNAELAAALEYGLKWTVIKWQVAKLYPQLASLISRALNVEHAIGEGDCQII